MGLYIGIAIVSCALAFGSEKTKSTVSGSRGKAASRLFMALLYLVLFVPAALRQATGNDYLRYVSFFHLASVDAYVPTEPGFNALAKLVYHLAGYENYLLLFAIYAGATIALFLLSIHLLSDSFAFSFFLFMAFGLYFQCYNTVRYYLALSMALVALYFFLQREYLPFLALVLSAALFHKSVLVVLVLYPLCRIPWKMGQRIVFTGLGAVFFATRSFWLKLAVKLYPSYEGSAILAAGGSITWSGILRCAACLILLFLCLRISGHRADDLAGPHRFYANAAFLSLWIYVFASFIPELSRICYYLTATQLFLVPKTLKLVPKEEKNLKTGLTFLVIACAVLYFAAFLLRADDPTVRILPYSSFLFSDLPAYTPPDQ